MYKSKYKELNYILYAEAQFLEVCYKFANNTNFNIPKLLDFLCGIANLAEEEIYTTQIKHLVTKALTYAPKHIATGYWVLMLRNLGYSKNAIATRLHIKRSSVYHHLGELTSNPRAQGLPPHWIYNLTGQDRKVLLILLETLIDFKKLFIIKEFTHETHTNTEK